MNIIGHQPTSFIDYPDKICTVIFVAGCNFKCPYCHNGHIVKGEGEIYAIEDILKFLTKRKKFIDGICISGGEPTLYEDLEDLIHIIKKEGFLVKLDTNGTNPMLLKKLLDNNMIDYIAMDIKAPPKKYPVVANSQINVEAINKSVEIIKASNIDYEFRTTVCKELLTKEDIFAIADWIGESKKYYLQNFHDRGTVLEGEGTFHPYEEEVLQSIVDDIAPRFEVCKLRK